MDKMIGHIFGSLDTHEKVLRKVCDYIKAQQNFNKYVWVCVVAGCVYVHVNEKAVAKLEKANKELTKRIEELEEKTLGEE